MSSNRSDEPGLHMQREIAEQPRVLEDMVLRRRSTVEQLRRLAPDPLQGIAMLGRGSSEIAGRYGAYLMELVTRRPVASVDPTIWTRYDARTNLTGWLAVAVSQSGRTPEICAALEAMQRQGAATLAVTNDPSSPLAGAAGAVVDLAAGPELAVPATKTYSSSLLALAHIAAGLGEVPWSVDDEHQLVRAVQNLVNEPEPVRAWTAHLHQAQMVHVGRGFTLAVAREAALKIEESALVPSRAYDVADLLHGPIATVGADTAAVGWSVAGPTKRDVADALTTLRERGCSTMLFGDSADTASDESAVLAGPGLTGRGLPEPLGAIGLAVRAQQLALHLALHRGKNPDSPAGLTKITATT